MSRTIDADALEELFREVIGGIAKKPEMKGNLEHMVRASAMVIEMIQDAPTIEPRCEACEAFNKTRLLIPQPKRKKGKWIDTTQGDHYKCSCCGTRAAFWFNEENSSGWEKDMSEWLSDFCPNCGAEMLTEDSECRNT